jgi:hypothetical protein
MPDAPRSSDSLDGFGLDEVGLAVLTACQQRGALTARAIDQLIAPLVATSGALARLSAAGWLHEADAEFAITEDGLRHLDLIIEGIQAEFTPDDPAYVSRYRREKPSLPFEANTVWAEAVCINIRLDPAALRPLVPHYFELDLHDGYAYVSLTASRLKNFGAGAVPNVLRTNFYQATYRAHVTYTDFRGRRTRGCYFVRSDTNSAIMSLTANLLPEFKAHHCGTCPMLMARNGDQFVLTVDPPDDPSGRVVLVMDTGRELDTLPASSRFRSVSEAYEYIVDFHDAFSFDPDTGEVFILRIDRGDWQIKIVEPTDYYLGYMSEGPFPAGSAELDSVFYFRNTPYRWLPLLKERVRAVRP